MEVSVQYTWQDKIEFLKAGYDNLHQLYSIKEGWAYISYKGTRTRIDNSMTIEEINTAILGIFKKQS